MSEQQKSPELEPKLQKLTQYVRFLADQMQLQSWKFKIDPQPCSPGSFAEIACAEKRKLASIQFCENFMSYDATERRHTVCHELLHAHFHPLVAAVLDLQEILGQQAFQIFFDRFNEAMEYAVDGIADAFAPCLPTMEEVEEASTSQEAE